MILWIENNLQLKVECPEGVETVGVIDEALNILEQGDPRLVEAVRQRYLVRPSKEPYNWGKEHRRSGLELAGQYGQERCKHITDMSTKVEG